MNIKFFQSPDNPKHTRKAFKKANCFFGRFRLSVFKIKKNKLKIKIILIHVFFFTTQQPILFFFLVTAFAENAFAFF